MPSHAWSCCCEPSTCDPITAGPRPAHDTPFNLAQTPNAVLRYCWHGDAFGQPYESTWDAGTGRRDNYGGERRYHRLFVYESVVFSGDAVDAVSLGQTPDYILVTKGAGNNAGGPFETAVGSGIYLDTEPYWWASCQLGGWADDEATHWYKPAIEDVDDLRASPVADGTYTILVLVSHVYIKQRAADGAAILVPRNKARASITDWRAIS